MHICIYCIYKYMYIDIDSMLAGCCMAIDQEFVYVLFKCI